jgi:general secretion pathway protein K
VPRNEEGFVLVTVLLVIALLFPVVIAFNSRVQLNLLQAENFRNSVQSLRMARSGVEGAIAILQADDVTYDSNKDKWAMALPALAVADGVLDVKVTDEDSKLSLNALVGQTGTDVNKDVEARLRSLITKLGGKPEIVDALIDWIDTDDAVTGSGGAEDEYYTDAGYRAKNGPLDSVDELLLVKGFDKELLFEKRLADFVTVAQTDGKINVNTAPVETLLAVLGTRTPGLATPLSESDVEDLVRYREENEFKTVEDVNRVIKISTTQAGAIAGLIKVNSSFFTVRSKFTTGKIARQVEAMLKRDGNTVATMSWREY